MALNRFSTHFFRLLTAGIAVTALLASEHHGLVKSGGLPVPGATIIATKGDERHVTTTDENARGNANRGGRGTNGANGTNGRPSLTQAVNSYQRVDVNSSGDVAAAGETGNLAANEASDLSGSADASFTINGSLSRGLDGP